MSKICRTCLAESTYTTSLFSHVNGDDRKLFEILVFVTDITINCDDDFPKQVCQECENNIHKADIFKRLCHKSDIQLKSSMIENFKLCIYSEQVVQVNNCQKNNDEKINNFINSHNWHNYLHRKEMPYQCAICHLIFPEVFLLERHVNFDHNNTNTVSYDANEEDKKDLIQYTHLNKNLNKIELYPNCKENILNDNKNIAINEKSRTNSPISETHINSYNDNTEGSDTETIVKCENIEFPKKTYLCVPCNFIFDKKKMYKFHLKAVHNEKKKSTDNENIVYHKVEGGLSFVDSDDKKIFKCKVCNLKFKSRKSCNIHLGRKHNIKEDPSEQVKKEKLTVKYEDGLNPIESSSNTLEVTVKNIKSEISIAPFECSMCQRKFTKKDSLASHIKRHEKSCVTHICKICKREFKHRAHLDNHILSMHTAEKGLKCHICSKNFTTQESLHIHQDSHKEEKKHKCKFCEKGFNMLSTLKDHIRTHTGEKPFLCSTCGRGFSQKTNLKEHMQRHLGFKPYKCENCDRRFVSKGELVAHTRKHSGAHPFVCDSCGSGFTTSSSLVKHRRIHTGEKPYACDFCPMRFTALGTLKNHRRTHTGEKPYKCTYCEKAFVQKNDLVSHTRCHTGERPYVCSTCGQSFRQGSALKTHHKMHNLRASAPPALLPLHCASKKDSLNSLTGIQGINTLAVLSTASSNSNENSTSVILNSENMKNSYQNS